MEWRVWIYSVLFQWFFKFFYYIKNLNTIGLQSSLKYGKIVKFIDKRANSVSRFRIRLRISRVRTQGRVSGSGFRVRIQGQDSGSGFRVRI
jgi:hypothetical protein